MPIRQWPDGERPREKLLARGAGALSDAELLAILMRSGPRGRSAVDLARELDPPSALRAAQVALESPDLADSKRARLEALIAELERPAEHEVHPPEQPLPAAPQTPSAPAPAQPVAAVRRSALAAAGQGDG